VRQKESGGVSQDFYNDYYNYIILNRGWWGGRRRVREKESEGGGWCRCGPRAARAMEPAPAWWTVNPLNPSNDKPDVVRERETEAETETEK
jgi:hypothetical protein